jgi:hypothetical protein
MMNPHFYAVLLSVILLVCQTAQATYQDMDVIEYGGESYCFGFYGNTPLVEYFDQKKFEYPREFIYASSACHRRHIASWRVVDKKLYLVQILVFDNYLGTGSSDPTDFWKLPSHNFPLQKLFPDAGPAVFANWFSGNIHLNEGSRIFEYTLVFTNGVCLNWKVPKKMPIDPLKPILYPDTHPARMNSPVTTNQAPDLLEYQRATYLIGTNGVTPLTDYYKKHRQPDVFGYTACEAMRGHVATWRIAEGKLWLVQVFLCSDSAEYDFCSLRYLMHSRRLSLESLFPGAGTAKFADWYTGTITVDGYRCDPADEENVKKRKTFEILKGVVTNLEQPEKQPRKD